MRLAASHEGTAPGGVPRQLFRTAWVRGACLFPWSRADLRTRSRESSICKSQRHFVSAVAAILKEVSLLRNFSPVTVFAYGAMPLLECGGG